MGIPCSKAHADDDSELENGFRIDTKAKGNRIMSQLRQDCSSDKASAKRLLEAHDADMPLKSPSGNWQRVNNAVDSGFHDPDGYFNFREKFRAQEKSLDFDFRCRTRASDLERRVDEIIQTLKKRDGKDVYDAAPWRRGYGGQMHKRFAGDHFLSNVDLINQTDLLKVVRRMPKGAHLHIHFNACLLPSVLLNIAKDMDRMFITSDLPLVPDNNYENFDRCEIQFSLKCPEKEEPGDLFSQDYQPRQTMKYSEFRERFHEHYDKASVDKWLMDKLVFNDEEAHNQCQTAAGLVKHQDPV